MRALGLAGWAGDSAGAHGQEGGAGAGSLDDRLRTLHSLLLRSLQPIGQGAGCSEQFDLC